MTVGIGVLCQRGTTAVIASDLRTTYPQSAVDANDVTGKQWDFDVPFPVVACVAGKLGACQAVVDELNNRLRKLVIRNGPIHCEHIENAIREARARTFRRLADWSIRMAYGMTLREWQRGKVPGGAMSQLIHDEVSRFIGGLSFEMELIVAGFLADSKILFFKGSGKRMLEASSTPGIHVIGSGGRLAMDHLNKREQNIDNSLPRTLLHLSEAMDEAQKVSDHSVGKPEAFMILRSDGRAERISADASIFRDWKTAYKARESTQSLDASPIAGAQVQNLLQRHSIRAISPRRSTKPSK